jgi:hypothetical protein
MDLKMTKNEKLIELFKSELEAALNKWKALSVTEVAAENPSVAEYCKHWEERALKAEAALKPGEPVDREQWLAIREGHFNAASAEYFDARPQLDSAVNRRIFYAGHCKGYDVAPPAQTPPRLTDEWLDVHGLGRGDARLVETAVRKQFGVTE